MLAGSSSVSAVAPSPLHSGLAGIKERCAAYGEVSTAPQSPSAKPKPFEQAKLSLLNLLQKREHHLVRVVAVFQREVKEEYLQLSGILNQRI